MDFLIGLLNVVIVLVSVFLVCIILIQRGKGGGLAGAFGGVGGSSAFGTKAGDVFTKITIGVAIGWMLTLMLLVVLSNSRAGSASSGWGDDSTSASRELSPSKSKAKTPATGVGPDVGLPPSPATDTGLGAPPIPTPVDIPAIPDSARPGAGIVGAGTVGQDGPPATPDRPRHRHRPSRVHPPSSPEPSSVEGRTGDRGARVSGEPEALA